MRKSRLKIIPVFSTFQRTFKFPDPEKYKKYREKLESLKYVFLVKLLTSYDWYPTKNMKSDYTFLFEKSCSNANITQNKR